MEVKKIQMYFGSKGNYYPDIQYLPYGPHISYSIDNSPTISLFIVKCPENYDHFISTAQKHLFSIIKHKDYLIKK